MIYRLWLAAVMAALLTSGAMAAETAPATVEAAKSDAVKSDAAKPDAVDISFRLDVMPVFFRAGCNSGGCHGSARGKDGFRLSLFGYDPVGDYFRLTQQIVGRRVDVAVPDKSLLLLKAVGKVPHTGGQLFTEDSEYYQTLLRWVEAGAPDDADNVPVPVGIELSPRSIVFDGQTKTVPTKVTARYSDGSHARRDAIWPASRRTTRPRPTSMTTAWWRPATAAIRSCWPALPGSPSAAK